MNELLEQPRQIRKFNPGTFQSDREVINQFVVRNRELGVVLDVLRRNAGSPSCQHVLLVAPRGRGKTMLLARVAAELRTDGDLSEQFLPIRFMEESQEIFNMGDFWLESLFYLAREHGVHDPDLSRELRDVHAALAAEWHGRELEERARAAVLEIADRLGKQFVLMVENLQALCRDVDQDFGWKLRAVLQSEPQIILLATATSRFMELDDAKHAFFELFRIVRLELLDTGECCRLWQMVTGDDVRTRVIRPLQILTGGDPRLLVIIGEFAQHQSLRQIMEDLVRLIDDHTEYFRAHLEGFAKTERRVYLALIDLWRPSTTGEIAARARLDVRTVSTLLGRLVVERGAVVVERNGRKRVYAAAQRLYSIYYKLRRERDEAAVVRNLIHFMAVLYSDDELPRMAGRLTWEAVQSPTIREGIERAIAEAPHIRHFFSHEEWQTISLTSERATAMDDKDAATALFNKGVAQGRLGDAQAAISTYDEVAGRFGDSDAPELQVPVATALFNKGVAQEQLGDAQAAISTYDEVAGRFGDSDAPELQVPVATALVNKGVAQGQLGDAQAAISTYDEVAGRFGDSDAPELQVPVATALVNKGVAQGQLGDAQAAISTYDEVAGRFGDSDAPELQVPVATALVNKGVAQGQLGDAQAAISTYDEVAGQFGDSDAPELQVQVATALFNKGVAQGQLGDAQAAISTYDEVAGQFGDSDAPELQVQVATALVNKGVAQGRLGDAQAAISTYDEVAGRFGDSDAPELQAPVATALFNKGVAQGRLGDAQAAISTYDEVAGQFGDSDAPKLQVPVATALVNKGVAQGQLGDAQAAISTYDEVAGQFGDSDAPELQVQVATALVNKGVAQGRLGDAQAAISTYDEVAGRFGDSDAPELQAPVATALFNKGVAQGRLGDAQAAISTYDEVAGRFGDSDAPELQVQVARSLVNRAEMETQLGCAEEALHTCEEFERRGGVLAGIEKGALERRSRWVEIRALFLLERHTAAMDLFRSVYAAFVPSEKNMVGEMLAQVPNLIAAGASERDLVPVLSSDSEKANELVPLVVALRQRAGEVVREPAEVLEIATDVHRRIEEKSEPRRHHAVAAG